jgi:hypothetical protein
VPRLLALLVALLVGGAVRAQDAVDWSKAEQVNLVMVDDQYVPDRLTLRQGQPYLLALQNQGDNPHEIRAPEFFAASLLRDYDLLQDDAVGVRAGWGVDLYVVPSSAGTFPFSDAAHQLEGMMGEIVVE